MVVRHIPAPALPRSRPLSRLAARGDELQAVEDGSLHLGLHLRLVDHHHGLQREVGERFPRDRRCLADDGAHPRSVAGSPPAARISRHRAESAPHAPTHRLAKSSFSRRSSSRSSRSRATRCPAPRALGSWPPPSPSISPSVSFGEPRPARRARPPPPAAPSSPTGPSPRSTPNRRHGRGRRRRAAKAHASTAAASTSRWRRRRAVTSDACRRPRQ